MGRFANSALIDIADVLDRPVWTSLTSCHAGFALGRGGARRFMTEAAPFAAARDDSVESIVSLERLIVARGGEARLMQAGKAPELPNIPPAETAPAVQMVAGPQLCPSHSNDAVRLTGTDAPEMQALAALAEPGPFEPLTHLLGRFWGIRRNNRLIAMAGERFRQPGFTEISAVSVHPDYRRQSLGSSLVRHTAAHILARGETPYLHTLADNTDAIRIYERLGFQTRIDMTVTWFSALTDPTTAEANHAASGKLHSFQDM
ncbi:GNAT family N-acetyltransferase [uncultured Roseobacter sp.]|uniref:GNAT family N-acetyltransferase n=1 Tax=uncultured Roseobacter sp. TaxID=114847 RepID=UPI002606A505|nr:GNAT family N-acetyltransferase [uncultured Roseobacter sp.]